MTKKPPDSSWRSLLLDLFKGVTDFMEEVTDALNVPSEDEQRLVRVEAEVSATQESVLAVEAEIDALQTAVEGIKGRQIKDTQTILETLEKLQQTQDLILDRVRALEEAGRIEEAARWKVLLSRVAKLILVLVGPVAIAEALRDAFVEEELYPWLKGLRKRAKDVLDAPESPLPTPTPTVEPTTTEESRSEADTRWSGRVRFDWVTIPAGWFWMGSDRSRDPLAWEEFEKPYHRVYVPRFLIARVPVTVAQFGAFASATGSWRQRNLEYRLAQGEAQYPVTNVHWEEAQNFCRWAKVRLPTEAQWEKAARGTDGRRYPWGNAAPDDSRCDIGDRMRDRWSDPIPVGRYPKGASPYGVLDMAGNVTEWTSSSHKSYPYDPKDGREDERNKNAYVLRGGYTLARDGPQRCAYRSFLFQGGGYHWLGFRVVYSSPPLLSRLLPSAS